MSCYCDKESYYHLKIFLVTMGVVGSLTLIILTSQSRMPEGAAERIQERLISTSTQATTTTTTTTMSSSTLSEEDWEDTVVECPTCPEHECPRCQEPNYPKCPTNYVPRKKDRFAFSNCMKEMEKLVGGTGMVVYHLKRYLEKVELYDDFCSELNMPKWRKMLREKKENEKCVCEKCKVCRYDVHSCGTVCLNYDFGFCDK